LAFLRFCLFDLYALFVFLFCDNISKSTGVRERAMLGNLTVFPRIVRQEVGNYQESLNQPSCFLPFKGEK